jgi:hypothetical protein
LVFEQVKPAHIEHFQHGSDKGYGLVLSSIHWKIRNEINENINDLFELLREEEIFHYTLGI